MKDNETGLGPSVIQRGGWDLTCHSQRRTQTSSLKFTLQLIPATVGTFQASTLSSLKPSLQQWDLGVGGRGDIQFLNLRFDINLYGAGQV